MDLRSLPALVSAAALLALGCVKAVPLADQPCPCAEGWQCCPSADVCVVAGESCPIASDHCVADCSRGCGPDGCGGTCGSCTCGEKACPEDQTCTPVLRCGTFEDVARPPKVMLVLDRSGSMKTLASSDTQYGCASDTLGNGYDPAGACKWTALKAVLTGEGGLLDSTGAQARIGLAVFPDPGSPDSSCGSGVVQVPVPSAPGASNAAIRSTLDSFVPGGGTPSAATLRAVAADSAFVSEEDATARIAVFITDGMPNCNSAIATCSACTNAGDPTAMCGDRRNCLDYGALIAAVKALRSKGVFTIVVGFGAALSNAQAIDVLDQAAVEGGMPQKDAATRFYQATNDVDLRSILAKLLPAIGTCVFTLSKVPDDPASLLVVLTDTTLQAPGNSTTLVKGSDWDYYDATNSVVAIKGEKCLLIQSAEPGRYTLSFLAEL